MTDAVARVAFSLPCAVVALLIGETWYGFGAFLPEAFAFIATYFVLLAAALGVRLAVRGDRPKRPVQWLAVRPVAVGAGLLFVQFLGPLHSFTKEMVVFFVIYAFVALGLDVLAGTVTLRSDAYARSPEARS